MHVDEVHEHAALVSIGHKLHALLDEIGGGAHAADSEEDVVLEEVGGQALQRGKKQL